MALYALFPTIGHIVMTYGSFIDDGFDGIKVLDLLLMAFGVLFVIGGIFYFSKVKTDLWSLALFVLGIDFLVLINAMITFEEIGVPDEVLPVLGLIFSVLIFWGSYVLLNKFRISLKNNNSKEGGGVENSS